MKYGYVAAIATLFSPVSAIAETPLNTSDDVIPVMEACLDLAAALDLTAGKAADISWDKLNDRLGQLNSIADDPISVASSATDAGASSSAGCEFSFKDGALGQAVLDQFMAERTEVMNNRDSGVCHNQEFISIEFKEWDGTSRYAPGVLGTISFSNLPEMFGNPCAS